MKKGNSDWEYHKEFKEKKTRITFSVAQSILKAVKDRQERGFKMSPFVEMLLVSWCNDYDKNIRRQDRVNTVLKKFESQGKDIDKLLNDSSDKEFNDFLDQIEKAEKEEGGK